MQSKLRISRLNITLFVTPYSCVCYFGGSLKMERVQGLKSKHSLYVDALGYIYRNDQTRNGKMYFRCVINSCIARITWNVGVGVPTTTLAHNHNADELEVLKCRFLQRLRERAYSENAPLHTIYVEEVNFHEAFLLCMNPDNILTTN